MRINNLFLIGFIILNLVSVKVLYADVAFHGEAKQIPDNIKKEMIGKSWNTKCPISLDKLSYLKIYFWGFDGKPHQGELIVYKSIAQNTIDTFRELFYIKFPIESMKLPETVTNKNENNTYAFRCMMDEQSPNKFSSHSYGISIDVNPLYNPAIIANNKVSPPSAKKYLDRKLKHQGMIKENDAAFNIFAKYGWYWGGFFPTGVDYQHFQKILIKHYIVTQFKYLDKKDQIITYGLTD